MGYIEVTECEIEGVKIIEPKVYGDDRGYFMETYQYDTYAKAGITCQFVQDNCALSQKGVLRGLHFQKNHAQDKLISVMSGEVYDVAVDLRVDSETYGKWIGVYLSDENKKQFFVPRGFAHGYLVLSESALLIYKCSNYYYPEEEDGIIWNDPDIGIEWPISEGMELIFSEKDQKWSTLR